MWIVFLLLSLVPSILLGEETGFLHRTVEVGPVTYKYQVFVPANWTPQKKWPVIFFLHGAGERGADGDRQVDIGLPARLREMKDFPAVVVMPQCNRGAWWGDAEMEGQAFAALEEAMKEFNGDPQRIYLTGLSMGGYGTWAFGYKYPEKFAALVPVCGGVVASRRFITAPSWHPFSKNPADPYQETASHLTKIPIWAFHGEMDPVVPAAESRKLTEAVKAAGGNVRYTEYPGVEHNSWDRAYWEEELLPWLLAQEKGK
ncbi:MAG: prolyl oligopeptidase family serine peptidase [Vicinamibacteria bacterium]